MVKALPKMKNAPSNSLGKNLRSTRKRLGLTISEVSRLTGLACSTISKVENDQMSLTYDKLSQLAAGLRIDIASLFRPDHATSPVVTARYNVDRPHDRIDVQAGEYYYSYLNTTLKHKLMTPMLGRTNYKSLAEFGDYVRHAGEEFLFVIEGKIAVHTEYYEPVILNEGESLYIDSGMGHAYLAADDGPCRFVSVCTGDVGEEHVERLKAASPVSRPERTGRSPKSSVGDDGASD
jgi:transcriptional regulator with XRE-family HTH domain